MQQDSDFKQAMAWRGEVLKKGWKRVIVLHDGEAGLGAMLKSVLARSGVMVLSPGQNDVTWLGAVAADVAGGTDAPRELVERFERMMLDGVEHGVEAVLVVWPALMPLMDKVKLGVPVIEIEAEGEVSACRDDSEE